MYIVTYGFVGHCIRIIHFLKHYFLVLGLVKEASILVFSCTGFYFVYDVYIVYFPLYISS
mgnify:CR=1 FL=1